VVKTNGDLLAALNKEVGERLVYGNSPTLVPEFLPTGFRNLDRILGGGLKKGSIAALTGPYSSGKSLMTQYFIKAAQDEGLVCAYIDVEQVFNAEWMAISGVKVDDLLVSKVVRGEEAFDIIHALMRHNVGLIVVDSLTALITESRAEAPMEQKFVGQKALLLNTGLEKVLDVMVKSNSKTILVGISQLRTAMGGAAHGPTEVMAGGKGLESYAHLILRVRRAGWTQEKSGRKGEKFPVKTGFALEIKTEKSKQSAPFQTARIPFNFKTQLDALAAIVYEAMDWGLIETRGSYFKVSDPTDGDQMIQGKVKLVEYARAHPEYVETLAIALEERGDGGDGVDDSAPEAPDAAE